MFTNLRTIGTLSILASQLLTATPAFAQQEYYDDRGRTYYDFICHEHNARGECTNYSYITPRARTRGYYDDYRAPTSRYTSDRYLELYRGRGIYDSSYYNSRSYGNGYLSHPYDYYTSPNDGTRYYRESLSSYPSSRSYRDGRYYDEDYYRDWYEQRYDRSCRSCRCWDDDDRDDDDCDD